MQPPRKKPHEKPSRLSISVYTEITEISTNNGFTKGRLLLWKFLTFSPLIGFSTAAFFVRPQLAPWVFMWTLAFAIFGGCKWLTLIQSLRTGAPYNLKTAGVYLTCWPGMNAATFLSREAVTPVRYIEWAVAIMITFTGVLLTWVAVRQSPLTTGSNEILSLLQGWLGMTGIILMLHFGTFHLLSLTLRWLGFNAPPIMKSPLLSNSVSDFWGRRWNQPFHELTKLVFHPLRLRLGPRPALWISFLLSGLIHELIITIPAGGGYGLPTLYFIIQGSGLLLERRLFSCRNNHTNILRRLFCWIVVVGPAGLLFPPIFAEQIVLPMLNAIGVI